MMPNNRNEEERIQSLMEELPLTMQTPSEFKSKLIDKALSTNTKPRAVRRPVWVAAMTCGVAAIALSAYLMSPKPAVSKTWTMVRQAVDRIQSFRMSVSNVVGGKRETDATITLSENGMLISADKGEIVYIDGSMMQVYDPEENTIVKMKLTGFGKEIQDAVKKGIGEGLSQLNLKDMIADLEKEYGKENIKIDPIRTENGRQVYDVRMRNPKDGSHGVVTVDAETDLPIKIVDQSVENGAEKFEEVTIEYNGRYELKPNFPKDAKIEEFDLSELAKMGMNFSGGFKEGENPFHGSFNFKFDGDDKKSNDLLEKN